MVFSTFFPNHMFYPVSNLWGIAWDSSETTHHPRHQPKRLAREQHIAAREERAARARLATVELGAAVQPGGGRAEPLEVR